MQPSQENFYFLLATFTNAQPEYTFMPTTYTVESVQRPSAGEIRSYHAVMCPAAVDYHHGYKAAVRINLPFNLPWKTSDGIVFARVSNSSTFNTTFCTNVNSSAVPDKTCSFVYSKDMGSNVYIEIRVGEGGDVVYSFGLDFEAPNQSLPSEKGSSQVYDAIKKFYYGSPRPKTPRSASAPYNSELVSYVDGLSTVVTQQSTRLKICLAQTSSSSRPTLIITVIGFHPSSAFSTYACSSEKCVPDVIGNTVIGSDVSDTTINLLAVDMHHFSANGTVYLLITGFGNPLDKHNNFHLTARMNAPLVKELCSQDRKKRLEH